MEYQKYAGHQTLDVQPAASDGLRGTMEMVNHNLNTVASRLYDHLISLRGTRPEPAETASGSGMPQEVSLRTQIQASYEKTIRLLAMLDEAEKLV